MLNKLSFYTFFMLLVPLTAWALDYQWQMSHMIGQLGLTFLVLTWTDTGSVPFAFMTCVLLAYWLLHFTKGRYNWRLVLAVCFFSQLGTQAIKEGMKQIFQEPRPFVVQLEQTSGLKTTDFYKLTEDQQAEVTLNSAKIEDEHWVAQHQAGELGYSFPSGHTIFAASWLMIFAGFLHGLNELGVRLTLGFMTLWAAGILASRVYLGMHYPIDLFVSSLIAWALHLFIFLRTIPFLETFTFFNKRG
ncbi:hypothetical protein A4G20_07775 [Pasteurellaceae bacterium RH1A]|nr:hypothetical protein A4G20_07775 [Pasteurellaceae bacterium RH1A]